MTTQQQSTAKKRKSSNQTHKLVSTVSIVITTGLVVSSGLLYYYLSQTKTNFISTAMTTTHTTRSKPLKVDFVVDSQAQIEKGIYLETACVINAQTIHRQIKQLAESSALKMIAIDKPCSHSLVGPFSDTQSLTRWRDIITKLTGQRPNDKVI